MSSQALKRTQQLVTLAQGGDDSALGQLCSIYGERVRRIVRLRMGTELRSKLESMDLVQDTLMCALRDLGDFTYRNEGDFLRWLTARYFCISKARYAANGSQMDYIYYALKIEAWGKPEKDAQWREELRIVD